MDRSMISERRRGFRELLEDRRGLLDADRYEAVVERIVRAMVEAFKGGRKVLWMGNGGSAADAQHLAARDAAAIADGGVADGEHELPPLINRCDRTDRNANLDRCASHPIERTNAENSSLPSRRRQ